MVVKQDEVPKQEEGAASPRPRCAPSISLELLGHRVLRTGHAGTARGCWARVIARGRGKAPMFTPVIPQR